MGYLHISNLYRTNELQIQALLNMKEVFALEKIHGTSAHISFNPMDGSIRYFSGGETHSRFVGLFNETALIEAFKQLGMPSDKNVTVYGEAYGGKQQGMSGTYGKELKFAVFDVKVGDTWLSVPQAEDVTKKLGLEFVFYTKIPTTLEAMDAARDADSQQAIRNGVGAGKIMEGVVLRPLIEMTLNNGSRIICKHKRDEFRETATPRPVVDPAQMQVLADAEAVANEWVVPERLNHVLDKIPDYGMEKIPVIVKAMVEDVLREGAGEIVDSKEVRKAISTRTVSLFKDFLKSKIGT